MLTILLSLHWKVSGGITAELSNILENPDSIIDLLANSLPAQSSYFIQIALASTFFLQSLEILRLYPLGMALLRRFVGPRVLEKERRKRWGPIASLEHPPEFWYETIVLAFLLCRLVWNLFLRPMQPLAHMSSFIRSPFHAQAGRNIRTASSLLFSILCVQYDCTGHFRLLVLLLHLGREQLQVSVYS